MLLKHCCRILFLWVCCAISTWVYAQQPLPGGSNLRQKTFAVKGDSLLLDTLSLVPGTDSINGISKNTYRIDWVRATLRWLQKPVADSITIGYRVFPYRFHSVAQRLQYDSIAAQTAIRPFNLPASGGVKSLFSFGNLQYSGSFGRGISFGNNQDAVVQSAFNLQLNGMLADSIQLAAAITDNNLPIQPDGTTQQLNEFDQVFLQFKKGGWQLNLGDIDLRQTELYFLNFYKRLQGVSFKTVNTLSPSVQSSTLVSGSIAKGKFNRNVFQGSEGNQGPYRLSGANNELYFIVLANTERVFIDGELLQRGENEDYIINYNTAEITFMPRRMITKDSRIQVEFEYADRNYLNANLYAFQNIEVNKKLKIKIGAFSNGDAKNSPINQPLSDAQKQFLFNLGDSVRQALYPAVAIDTFGKDKILYEMVFDTTTSGIDSFYRYATDPAVARYALSFTDLGAGNGNYAVSLNGANGKVFEYLPPLNGVKRGRYEPVVYLVTPKKQQLFSAGVEYAPNEHHLLKTELALSDYDANTLSSKNSGDDKGVAAKLQYTNIAELQKASGLQLVSIFNFEKVAARFKPLERLRFVEFSREWGLPPVLAAADETILKAGTGLKNKESMLFAYQFTSYKRSDGYAGFQNNMQQHLKLRGWASQNNILYTRFSTLAEKGSYLRPTVDLQKTLKQAYSLQLRLNYTMERNEVRAKTGDSLSALSFAFDTYTASLRTAETCKNNYSLTFFTRANRYAAGKELEKADRSYNLVFGAQIVSNPKHQLFLNTSLRQLTVLPKNISTEKDDATLLGRAEYVVNEWKEALTGTALFELGTGQEQRRDFTYIEVPAGQGEYTWADYNSDGVQQLNEFETAQFRDQARFVRIFVPTNDFIKAHFSTLNYNFTLSPRQVWQGADVSSIKKLIARFQLQSSMQTTKKTIAALDAGINPLKYGLQDTALLTLNTTFAHTLSFNRYSSVWGLDVSNFTSIAKALLTYGYESRQNADWIARLRWMWSRSLTFELSGRQAKLELYTPSFENRNYAIAIVSAEPRVSLVQGTAFRLQGSYKWEQKENAPEWGGQQSGSHAVSLETKYNVLQNSSVGARFVYNNIHFTGKTATTIAYTMLDGLLPGQNFLWTIDLTKRLLNNVELNFQYDGRQPAGAKTIHTGRASLRALF